MCVQSEISLRLPASNCPVNDGVKCQGSEPSHTAQGWSRILMRHARDDMHAGAA